MMKYYYKNTKAILMLLYMQNKFRWIRLVTWTKDLQNKIKINFIIRFKKKFIK